MHPVLIDLGRFALPTYGVLIAVGVLLGLWTLRRRAADAGLDADRTVDFALWLVIWALLGAKVLLVLVELPRYLHDPLQLVRLVRAGGVFLGGFLAALVAAAVLLRRYGLPALATFDVMAPSLALGHSIGRIGCFMAGCCWGASCELPWAVTYTDPRAAENVGTPLGFPLHPFPLYAAAFNFALYLLLAAAYRRRPPAGRVFATYLAVYGVGRYLLEYTRGDAARGFVLGGWLSTSQAISIALVAVGAALFVWAGRRRKR